MQDTLVVLGEIVKAHGLRGEVKVRSEICDPENFRLPGIRVQAPDGTSEPVTVLSYRVQKGAYILCLADFSTIDQVLPRIGWQLVCYGSQLPALPVDEYYHYQLIGLPVFSRSGEQLGFLTEIMGSSFHEVYVIRPEAGARSGPELLLPAAAAYILEIDLEAGRIVVDPDGNGAGMAEPEGGTDLRE
jgi:16S rRNA processing protein RimM